jgi:hypothetical protein
VSQHFQLSEKWRQIEQSGALSAAAIRFLDTGTTFPTGPVLVGVDGLNQRHLCIPAPSGELGREDKRSRGVTIEVRPLLNPQGHEVPFVDVHCRKPELNALFETVSMDILAASERKPDSPFITAHNILERWRELLEPVESGPLGPKQLSALLAELLLLERLGRKTTPPVKFWLGPERGPHDFVCGHVDFEVKSTLSTTRREVEVHSLAQLIESPETRLYLWWVRLRLSPGRGMTVPQTVDQLVARGVDAPTLMKKLKLAGYVQNDALGYRNIEFEVIESALYAIDNAFPRLTTASFVGGVPLAVARIDYTINLDASEAVPIEQSAADGIFDSVEQRA